MDRALLSRPLRKKAMPVLLAAAVILAILYMVLDTWAFEIDRCSELICTEGYPCFEQGDCSHYKGGE